MMFIYSDTAAEFKLLLWSALALAIVAVMRFFQAFYFCTVSQSVRSHMGQTDGDTRDVDCSIMWPIRTAV